MLKTILLSMGRDQILNILIAGAEALKESDIDEDSNNDEIAFDMLIAILKALK